MTVFSAVGKEKGPCLRPSPEMESCTCQVDRVTFRPDSACLVPVPADLGERKYGQSSQGSKKMRWGGGRQRLEGLGAASSPSSPAPEEPRLAKNVNKEETVLAKQRLQDNSWPKQSSQGPHLCKKTSQAFVHTQ